VTPTPETINDASQYEFFAGREGNRAVWTRDFARIRPMAEWNNHCGCETITYNAPLKRYFLSVTDGRDTYGEMDSYLLESEQVSGPWRMVAYLPKFGPQAYFINIPSKFISADGMTMWLCYSANFNRNLGLVGEPPGSRYAMCLQQVKLVRRSGRRAG
jgi:hypothetical protein